MLSTEPTTLLITAADDGFLDFLDDLIATWAAGPLARTLPLAVLDVGLSQASRDRLAGLGIRTAAARWDVDFPDRPRVPAHRRALIARPFLRDYFPGFQIYMWLDADLWLQDDRVLAYYLRAARRGKLPIVQETDRGYWTLYKRPKLWSQNHKAFAYNYGWRLGDRLGRNPILNAGAWALAADAPHWDAWARAMTAALTRKHWRRPDVERFEFRGIDQTSLNYVVFHDKLPTTFLPAYCNWFCGKGTPMVDLAAGTLVEPHEPHEVLGLVHLAGHAKDRVFEMATVDGGRFDSVLTYRGFRATVAAGQLIHRPRATKS